MADKNQLFYGDNYEVLRLYIRDESVDLVYLDPPFNSRQDYSVLFAEKDGSKSSAQADSRFMNRSRSASPIELPGQPVEDGFLFLYPRTAHL